MIIQSHTFWFHFREKAENDLAAKMESLALERKEDERQLEALSQKILDGQMRQSQQVATAIADQNDQSKRILDNLRMTKADNQRRELLNQASHALEKYHQCLARCEGIEVVESGFNLERMTSVMSEVIYVFNYYAAFTLRSSQSLH